jgi:peptidoglycan/xylan/chitin deacetylase (PgdA/CDA1 family)
MNRTDTTRTTIDDGPSPTRRNYLKAVGAGAGALALGGLASGSATAQEGETSAKLVFVYDDGYVQDYTQTYPIHRQLDAPACVAIPSSTVGRNEEFMTEAQLKELADNGWEVISHAVTHDALGAVPVTQDVAAGDTRLYVRSNIMGRTPHEAEILQGDKRAVVEITGKDKDDTGGYLTLKSEVGDSFTGGEARIRFTEEVIRSVLKDSKTSLEERGFEVNSFVYPYGRYDQRTKELVKEHYGAVANAYPGGLNTAVDLDPYELRREYFHTETMSEDDLAEYLDRIASRNTLGLLGGHTRNPALTGERIKLAIEMARERDIEIVTLQQALVDFGVYEPSQTPSETPAGTPTGTENGSATPTGESNQGPVDEEPKDSGGIPILSDFFDWLVGLFS